MSDDDFTRYEDIIPSYSGKPIIKRVGLWGEYQLIRKKELTEIAFQEANGWQFFSHDLQGSDFSGSVTLYFRNTDTDDLA